MAHTPFLDRAALLSRGATLLCALVLAGPAAAAGTLRVASDGSAPFLEVQAAIDAASDGDVILVGPGTYAPITIVGKSLTIVTDSSAFLFSTVAPTPGQIAPTAVVRDLGANQLVVLDGFTIFTSNGFTSANLLLRDCAGSVWIQNCFCDSYGAPALVAERCDDVVLVDSIFQTNMGTADASGTPHPLPGLHLEDSQVHAYEIEARGSHGTLTGFGLTSPNTQSDGGAGALVRGGTLRVQGGHCGGGGGSSFETGGCLVGGDGGPGLVTELGASAPLVLLVDTALLGGNGAFVAACAPPTSQGPATSVAAGTLVQSAVPARSVDLAGSGVGGGVAVPVLRGQPGDTVLLFVAPTVGAALPVGDLAIHLAGTPTLIAVVSITNQLGVSVPLGLPLVAPGTAITAGIQAAVVDPNLQLFLTNPAWYVVR